MDKKALITIMLAFCAVFFVITILYIKQENTRPQSDRIAVIPDETQNTADRIAVIPDEQIEPSQESVTEVEEDAAKQEDYLIETEESIAEPQESSDSFYYTELTDDIKKRITGKSYPDTEETLQITYEDLAYVHVLHYDFEGHVQEGELICNRAIAQDLTEIFRKLYDNQYPIEKIRLVDEYNADDEASMADNNTSCFNYRTVPGKTKLSNHSYGRAIDINPLYNPYVRTQNGETLISPDNGAPYADRSVSFPYKIDKEDLCWKIFTEYGFEWGGAWNSSKDYQHFEKTD